MNENQNQITESGNRSVEDETKSPSSSQRVMEEEIHKNISRFRDIIEEISDAGSEESKQVMMGIQFNHADSSN